MPARLRPLLLMLTPLALSACSDPPPERLKGGDELYAYYCRNCHQQQGLGPQLERLPARTPPLQRHEVVLMIKHGYGEAHRNMPVFTQLSDAQADAVAHYILLQRQRVQSN